MSIKPLPLGALLANDDYEITEVLGRGGFGITYLAQDRQLRSTVAVKEYAPADFAERAPESYDLRSTDSSEFDWGLNRFREEGRTLARFSNTPSIVSVARIFEENRTVYLVMEYIDGPNIVEFCESLTNPEQIEELIHALQGALSSMHDVGFIHSDLKPDNILIRTESAEPVLIDFGSTRQQSVDRTMALVTPHYSPVEQYASDSAHGPYTDIYSLSATFYRVITGKKPPDAPSRVLDDDCVLLQDYTTLTAYSADMLAQIDAGMRPLPKDRPQSISEWKSLTANKPLKEFVPTQPEIEKKTTKQESPQPSSAKLTDRWGALSQEQKFGGLAGVILVVVAIVFFPSDPRDGSIASGLNDQALEIYDGSARSEQPGVPELAWQVAVDANAWTPIRVKAQLKRLPTGTNYDLTFAADEPFRVKTSKGLAIGSKPGKNYGLVEGEIYLKSVDELPQVVEAKLVRRVK